MIIKCIDQANKFLNSKNKKKLYELIIFFSIYLNVYIIYSSLESEENKLKHCTYCHFLFHFDMLFNKTMISCSSFFSQI